MVQILLGLQGKWCPSVRPSLDIGQEIGDLAMPVFWLAALVKEVGASARRSPSCFNRQGLGVFLLSSVNEIDAYAEMGLLVFSSLLITVAMLIGDLLYGVLDPSLRRYQTEISRRRGAWRPMRGP